MKSEDLFRNFVKKLLIEEEEERTRGVGKGGIKKELADLRSLAEVDPQRLMANLNISSAGGDNADDSLQKILDQALGGTEEMGNAYGEPFEKKDSHERLGFSIPVTGDGMNSRDGLIYIRETFKGVNSAGLWQWSPKEVQVEQLGGNVIVYVDEQPFSWNQQPGKKKKKKSKDSEEKG